MKKELYAAVGVQGLEFFTYKFLSPTAQNMRAYQIRVANLALPI